MNKLSKYALTLVVCAGLFSCSGGITLQGDYNVVPLPQEITMGNGQSFTLNPSVTIYYPQGNEQMAKNANFLASYIQELTGYTLQTIEGDGNKGIKLALDENIANPEGYKLIVNGEGIQINGATPAGVFYGIQTLRKSG